MSSSSFIRVGLFKSPFRVVAAFLLRSRETQAKRSLEKSQEIEDLKRINQQQRRVVANAEEELSQKRLEIAQLKAENQRLREQPPVLPHDPPRPHHHFGSKMISVCVNLDRAVGLRASQMPPEGVALTHRHVRVLTVKPGVNWKREDMAQVYEELADRIGAPLAVVVDGAVELREGAEIPQKRREDAIILGDFKHHAANVLKKIVGGSERFASFTTQVGSARSAVQQTELGHLTPPSPRPKARFMNLAATLTWAQMVLWQLAHPYSKARHEITTARLNEKLGWVRTFREDIPRWSTCQAVVSASVTFINEQGLFRGAADQLAEELDSLQTCDESRAVTDQLLAFVRQSEGKLAEGQRLPLSTEIRESSFGLFKQLERQHRKGGFTSLLAAFGALLKPAMPESIRNDFARVSVKQMRTWVTQNLKITLASQRKTAYAESRNAA